jgi:hypothetical protein
LFNFTLIFPNFLEFLKFKSQNEAPTAENYPYKAKNDKCKMHDMPKVKLNINDIFEFKFKGDDRQMRLRLVNHGPLVIAMYVNDKSGLFQNYKKGIFYERGCPSSCKDVNHSMLLVGYGVTNDVPRKRFYLILNSWVRETKTCSSCPTTSFKLSQFSRENRGVRKATSEWQLKEATTATQHATESSQTNMLLKYSQSFAT